jgi:ATP-dependent helicase/DNAse subunit B
MPTRLILSPPATGKTEYCIENILATLKEHPLANVRVVVPDRLQASYFRRRLSLSGGALGAYVGTFSDLYKNILEHAGNYVPVASNALLHRILQETVDATSLVHYAPLRTLPGFLLVLRDSFAELKRALIYPEAFVEQSQNASLAQRELAQLYLAYQARLRELGWADIEGLSWLAVESLESNPALLDGTLQLLVVDGFDSFISTQCRALQLIAKYSDVLITLEGEENSQRPAHRRFIKTLEILRRELSPQTLLLSRKPILPPDVLHIEERVFETGGGTVRKPEQAFLSELRSPSEEAREALRWIKSLAVRNEIPLHECAIFTPSPDVYQPLIRSAAREFGIPVHFTQNDPLTSFPPIGALIALLSLPAQNFKTRTLFKVLRSPYFSFLFESQTIDTLEQVSRVARIVEGKSQWDETWERLAPTKTDEDFDLDDERRLPGLPRGNDAVTLRSKLDTLFTQLSLPAGIHTQIDWVGWLEDLLDALHFYELANSERDELACEALRDALRALVMSESITGDREVDFQQFISDLQSTFEGSALTEPRIQNQPALLVGNMREARGLRYQAVTLLGFSEGVFPEVERPDPFLTEELRAALGLDLRLERDQASLFYQAVTRTDQHLLMTRPYLSDDGEKWEASPFWNAMKSLFDKTAVQTIRPDDPRSLNDAASSQELLFWAVRRKGLPKSYEDLLDRWQSLQHARDVLRARRAKKAEGIYEGSVPDLKEVFSARYGPDKTWSASRLESFGACPLMFYASVALGLDARSSPELGLDVMQMGSILHKILEETYRSAENPTDINSVLSHLPEIAKRVFTTAPQEYGFRPSGLWAIEQEQFLQNLDETIQALGKEAEGWTPFAYEQKFGIGDSLPLEIQVGDERILLRGVIDRLDKNPDGEIRIVDYKTGSSHLDKGDLNNGRRLQLPIYALAVRDALKLGNPADGMYWAIKAAKAGSLKLASFENENGEGVEAAINTVKEHLLRIITAIRSGEFPPIPPKGGCPEYCPAAQWCWRVEKGGWS